MSAATAKQVQTAARFTGDRVPLQSDRALPPEGLFSSSPAPRGAARGCPVWAFRSLPEFPVDQGIGGAPSGPLISSVTLCLSHRVLERESQAR